MTFPISPTPVSPLKSERFAKVFLVLALGCVPFSTALTNLFVTLCYVAMVPCVFRDRSLRSHMMFAPSLFALALLGLFILGASWSNAPHADTVQGVRKYSKLLLLPIAIALSWRDEALSRRALAAFMAGCVWLALSCYLVRFNSMPTFNLDWWRVGDTRDAVAHKNHITVGIMLGFAALVCLLKATYPCSARVRWGALAGAVLFSVPILFLTQGRTGYVVMLIGLVTLLALRVGRRKAHFVAGMAAVAALFVGVYFTSDNMRYRTELFVSDVQNFANANAGTANGLRLTFFKVGAKSIAEHPWLGIGTGTFAELYAPTAREIWGPESPHANDRMHAHSEFLGVTVQLGVVGLIAYVGMLASLGRAALGPRSFEADSMVLMWVIYVSTSVYNSLLWDPTEAFWFTLLGGCLYAANVRRLKAAGPVVAVPIRAAVS